MAKTVVCEVLSTVKGLDAKNPKEYTHAGTADEPTLVELPDNAATTGLIRSGALRIYPGKQVAAQPETEKVKALQSRVGELESKVAELESSLSGAGKAAVKTTALLREIAAATDLEAAKAIAREALD